MILCSGVFDGLHAGHVGYLQAAAALDYTQPLVVAVASDAYVEQYKGHRPRFSLEDRLTVVHALRCVSGSISHNAEGVEAVIRATTPKWFVKGLDWKDRLPANVIAACEAIGARVLFVDSGSSVHTSDARATLSA